MMADQGEQGCCSFVILAAGIDTGSKRTAGDVRYGRQADRRHSRLSATHVKTLREIVTVDSGAGIVVL